MSFYEKLMKLDRRWVYLAVAVAVTIPVLVPFKVPVYVTPETKAVYDFVEGTKPGEIIFLVIDYDPTAMAEMHPMARVIMRQAFSKNIKLLLCALSQNGAGMAEQLISQISKEYNKKNGVDYVYLGYKPYPGIVILAMGQNFRIPFPTDYYNTPLDSLPLMDGLRNYDDVKGVVVIESGNVAEYWINYANGRYKAKVYMGVTGVMTADYYPFLQSGQLSGLIGGLKGASEYERLAKQEGVATEGMSIQTVAHLVVIAFIVLGNIGYFMSKKSKNKEIK